MNGELETKVKLTIYDITAETGRVPNSLEVARKIDLDETDVLDAFARLHAKRLLVPEPGDPSRIRMAPPFSGIATAFPVETVNSWCEARGIPRRPLISLAQLWQLAMHWYANHLTVESRRPVPEEMMSIFESIGLTGPFWDPKSDQWTPAN